MRSEEEYIEARFGRKRPFKVPEGYFESIESRIIEQLPERRTEPFRFRVWVHKHYRYAVAVAASVCIAVFGTVLYVDRNGSNHELEGDISAFYEEQNDSHTMDYVAEYTMMDNDDIYAFVSNY